MARIEKTVFISYRRKDIAWALAVYEHLTHQKYDVFFDVTNLAAGAFEHVIVSNIKARAHFIVILTPDALDRCDQPGDWLRREIETAIDEKRNIVPLLFNGFSFSSSSVIEKLTGKLKTLNQYHGLEVPSGFFIEAMDRLRKRYLNVPLEGVIHAIPTEVRKAVREEKVAANKALVQNRENIRELIRSVPRVGIQWFGIGAGLVLFTALGIIGINSWIRLARGGPTPTPAQTAVPLTPPEQFVVGSTQTSPVDSMIQLYVPAGNFTMGSNDPNEGPIHPLFVDAFWIDQTEVTNAMYSGCVNAGTCKEPSPHVDYEDPDYASHPVVFVSWKDANNYCTWANRRLPTEEEWEKAASWDDLSGNKRKYPWGDAFSCASGNFADATESCDGFARTSPVGHFSTSASAYGALDMAGNVWEWVSSLYQPYPYNQYDGREDLDVPGNRVMRGGSWNSNYYEVRTTVRREDNATRTYASLGFRCAMDASE